MTRRLAAVALLAVAAAGCGGTKHAATPTVTVSIPAHNAAFALPAAPTAFGAFTPVPLLGADAPAYAGPATPHSLDGVRMTDGVRKALANPGVAEALAANGFVVVPSSMRLFQYAYEGNVYAAYPVFVTTDAAYHVWHLVFDKTLRSVEQDKLLPKLQHLVAGSLASARKQAKELSGTPLAEAATRAEELFQVAAAELGQGVELDATAAAERKLVDAHAETAESPILGVPTDYSLFTPRGHYTRSKELTRYFLAMSTLGQLAFCLPGTKNCPGSGPLLTGLLATRILERDATLLDDWRAIYEPTGFLVGSADDYTPPELAAAATKADPGWLKDPTSLAETPTLVTALNALVAERVPAIDPERASVRFMGTRITVDGYVLDQLVAPNVGTADKPRLIPSGLDVAAALGSETAYATLKQEGATACAHYDGQLAKVRQAVGNRAPKAWGSTVYDAWLYALQPLFSAHGAAFPDFMRSTAWAAKDQQSGLGSYTELKHDTILYAKQFFAEGGGDPMPKNPRNWVEPDPVAFQRLAAAADLLGQGLDARGLLTEQTAELIKQERGLFRFLGGIAADELAGKPLAEADNARLRFLGSELETFWTRSSDFGQNGVATQDQQDALVADLGSSAKNVLEIGTGRIDRLYVLVPDDSGGFEVAAGGVYSYYEFTTPAGQRLDDASWRDLLDRKQAPARPAWEQAILAGRTLDTLAYGGGY